MAKTKNLSELTPEEILNLTTHDYLKAAEPAVVKYIIDALNVPNTESIDDDDKPELVADYLLEHPEQLLRGLTVAELATVFGICTDEEQIYCSTPQTGQMSLYGMQLISIHESNKHPLFFYYIMPKDLKAALKPHIQSVMGQKVVRDENKLESTLMAFLNLFGIVTVDNMCEYMYFLTGLEKGEVYDYLQRHFIFSMRIYEIDGKDFIVSPFLDYGQLDDIAKDLNACPPNKFNFEIEPKEYLNWGNMPYPVANTKLARPLLDIVEDHIGDRYLAESIVCLLWAEWQNYHKRKQAIRHFNFQLQEWGDYDTELVNNAAHEFIDSIPMWRYRGFTCPATQE